LKRANDVFFELLSPVEPEEEEVDPKAKHNKKPDKPSYLCFTEAEEKTYEHRILYLIGSELEVASTINFKIGCCYQGPDYEDDTPLPVEEVLSNRTATKTATNKSKTVTTEPEEPVIRMVTPDPEMVVNESGRLFQFELGRNEFVLKPDHTEDEINQLNEEGKTIPEDWHEEKWIRYRFNQTKKPVSALHSPEESKIEGPEKPDDSLLHTVLSEEGITSVENIDF
jgi:hypothetical protein